MYLTATKSGVPRHHHVTKPFPNVDFNLAGNLLSVGICIAVFTQ